MLRILLAFAIFFLCISRSNAQQPTISSIDKSTGTVNTILTITGSNFGTDVNLVKVAFGPAFAEVISVTGTSITVKVPAGAAYTPISVTNLESNLSAISKESFLLSFGGDAYDNSAPPTSYLFPAESGLIEHCLCDFNNDGLVDIAAANSTSIDISILKNTSTISTVTFSKSKLTVNGSTLSVACEDLDGDGRKDMIASKGGGSQIAQQIYVLENITSLPATIDFQMHATLFAIGNVIQKVIIEDIDMDGKADIIASSADSKVITIFRNKSTIGLLRFEPPISLTIENTNSTSYLVAEDLNNDGLPEIIASSFLGQQIFVIGNKSTSGNITFQTVQEINVASGINNIVVGDLNSDKKKDILYTNFSTGEVVVLSNKTENQNLSFEFEDPLAISAISNVWGLDIGDIQGDGKVDIVTGSTDDSKRITILSNTTSNGVLSFERISVITSEKSKSVRIIDLNNDGKPDINYAGVDNNQIIIHKNMNCIASIITASIPLVICAGTPLQLQVPAGINAAYQWSLDNNDIIGATNNTYNVSVGGSYKVRIKEATSCDRTSEATLVTVIDPNSTAPYIQILTDKDEFCTGDSVLLDTYGSYEGYEWEKDGVKTGANTKSIYAKAGGEYKVTVSVNGGCSTFGVKTVVEHSKPEVIVTSNINSVRKGLQAQLTTSGALSYSWSPGTSLNDSTIANPVALPSETTTYKVTGMNESGCTDSKEITITVESTNINVTPKKVFTPNFDGVNDNWIIENIENYPDCDVIIYNRSGQKVFEAKPYTNNFTGITNGKLLPAGDYYYVIQSIETNAEKRGGFRIIW